MKRCSPLLIIREMQIKSQWGMTLHWSEWLVIKTSTNSREGVKKRECKCVGGNVNWCSHYGELYGVSFKKNLKTELPLLFSHSVMSDSLWPHGLQLARFPFFHHLLKLAQTHVYWVGDAMKPSHPLSSPSPPAFNLSQHQGLFQWVSSSHQVVKVWNFSFSISPSSEY